MVRIGKIRSLHGIHGDVMMEHQLRRPLDAEHWEAMMIELLPGSFIPFFIESLQPAGPDMLLVKFEELKDRNEAALLMHKNVFAPPGILAEVQKGHDLDQFLGTNLCDQNGTPLGKVDDIFVNGPQVLFRVVMDTKEMLIPFADDLLLGFDPKTSTLTMQVADGLTDL